MQSFMRHAFHALRFLKSIFYMQIKLVFNPYKCEMEVKLEFMKF
jgi:hypothetical protein